MRRPPSRSATPVPPPASWAILNKLPPPISASEADRRTDREAAKESLRRAETVRPASDAPTASAVATNVVTTMPITDSENITTSHFVLRRAVD